MLKIHNNFLFHLVLIDFYVRIRKNKKKVIEFMYREKIWLTFKSFRLISTGSGASETLLWVRSLVLLAIIKNIIKLQLDVISLQAIFGRYIVAILFSFSASYFIIIKNTPFCFEESVAHYILKPYFYNILFI